VYGDDPDMTGQKLWDYMKDELYVCEDVLALIDWGPEGPPTGSDFGYSDLGHAMTMVGFNDSGANENIYVNDPGNNKGRPAPFHNWLPSEYASYGVTIKDNTIEFTIAGKTAIIYGAVTASPVPEPATLSLLALGGLALLRRKR